MYNILVVAIVDFRCSFHVNNKTVFLRLSHPSGNNQTGICQPRMKHTGTKQITGNRTRMEREKKHTSIQIKLYLERMTGDTEGEESKRKNTRNSTANDVWYLNIKLLNKNKMK